MNLPDEPIEIFNDTVRVGAWVGIPSQQSYRGLKYDVCERGIIRNISANNIAKIDMCFTGRILKVPVSAIKIKTNTIS